MAREGGGPYVNIASFRVLRVGPAEWLAIGCESPLRVSDTAPFTIVDLTDAFVQVEIVGEAVEELLMGLCGLDVHRAAFAPGTCARTQFASVAVVLDRHGAEEFACYVPAANSITSWQRYVNPRTA